MGYWTQAVIAADQYMRERVAQAAAVERNLGANIVDPDRWTHENRRTWASAPGWDTSWEYAVETGVEDPGKDPAVITDQQILSQVQLMAPRPPGKT